MAKDIRSAVKSANAQPVAPTTPVKVEAEVALTIKGEEVTVKSRKYQVSLPHLSTKVFEAETREEAVQKYQEWFGIIHTGHEFTVSVEEG